MKRAENYRGKKPRTSGLTAGQVSAVFIAITIAILFMTMQASGEWTGMSIVEQLHQALFVATDLD